MRASAIQGGPALPFALKMSPVLPHDSGSARTSSVHFSHRGATLRRSSMCMTEKPPTCCAFSTFGTRSFTFM